MPEIDDIVKKTLLRLGINLCAERWLLAVSGGRDSMCLLEYCHEQGVDAGIAHCNFMLRGEESMQDELLVQDQAGIYKLPFYSRRFDTRQHAEKTGQSIQEAARELRYDWLEEIRATHGFDRIITAHHARDSRETFFINLLRGTGIKGLTGIPVLNGKILRPFIAVQYEQLIEYARNRKIRYREDSSNKKPDYLRNRVRHELLPLLENIRSGAGPVLDGVMSQLRDIREVITEKISQFEQEHVQNRNGLKFISYTIFDDPVLISAFRVWLRKKGFRSEQVELIEALKDAQAGKFISGRNYEIAGQAEGFWIRNVSQDTSSGQIQIEKDAVQVKSGDHILEIRKSETPLEGWECFDLEALTFPLTLRTWQAGDRLRPLGMKGSRKVSDLLTDLKVPRFLKEEVKVLCSGDEIIWVMDYRRGQPAMITTDTSLYWCIRKC